MAFLHLSIMILIAFASKFQLTTSDEMNLTDICKVDKFLDVIPVQLSCRDLDLSNDKAVTLVNPQKLSVKLVEFSNAALVTIPRNLFKLVENATSFKCIYCTIEYLETESFKNGVYLEVIDIPSANLRSIGNGIFEANRNLWSLNLKGNTLTTLDLNAFPTPNNIARLSINVADPDMINTHLFKIFPKLYNLNLCGNGLTSFDGRIFEFNPELSILNLKSNDISEIHGDTMLHVSGLKKLNLKFNELSSEFNISNIANLTSLVDLSLAFNKVTHIGYEQMKESFLHLEHLDIHGNKFDCDYLKKMENYFKTKWSTLFVDTWTFPCSLFDP